MTNKNIFDVSNEVVVITGGNGQLGYQYSKLFLENGAKVCSLDIVENEMSSQLSKAYSGNYVYLNTDITDKASLSCALVQMKEALGNPSVLICNAAIDSPPSSPVEENGPFEGYPVDSWDKVINVNLKGVFLSCQVIGGDMAKNGGGSIVNISSIYGLVSPDQKLYEYRRKKGEEFYKPATYSVSKSGIINFTKYLAVYWAKKNIRVNTLTLAGVFNNQDTEFLNAYCDRIPIGRMANPDEYNGALLFLASKASSYMTGSNIIIDGGWTAI